jgi:hypothetical protein
LIFRILNLKNWKWRVKIDGHHFGAEICGMPSVEKEKTFTKVHAETDLIGIFFNFKF